MESVDQLKQQDNALFREGNYEEACLKYLDALALDDKNVVLYTNLSQCYFLLGRYNESLDNAKKATQIDKTFAKGWYRTGAAYEALEKFPESIENYLEAVELLPPGNNFTPAQTTQRDECENSLKRVLPKIRDPLIMPYDVFTATARAHDLTVPQEDTRENRMKIINNPVFTTQPPFHALFIPDVPWSPIKEVTIADKGDRTPEILKLLHSKFYDSVTLHSEYQLVSVRDDKLWGVGFGRPHVSYEALMDDNAVSTRQLNERACQLLRRPETYGPILVMKTTMCKWDMDIFANPEAILCWEQVTEAELMSEKFTLMRAEWEKVKRGNANTLADFLGPDAQYINLG
ncbi:hypothetical protein HGRIS_014435 [Hohenbuehelia grisea]|uniref:Uncharacterized protein n=1 Tax=Hohenbuehelia grisea TaxID=104357 RepID=A0ABR3JTJ1_9AGAR